MALTPRENFEQTLGFDGKPDRFVNQYDFMGNSMMSLLFFPYSFDQMPPEKGAGPKVNPWGVTYEFREDQPGAFPYDDYDHLVIKDFEDWKDYVKAPSLEFPQEAWDQCIAMKANIPEDQIFGCTFVAPGLFEQLHNLGSMTEALAAFYEYEDEIHELLKYLTEWELKLAEGVIDHLHPEMMLHHDDWGSRTSTFLSPEMFEEFLLEPYKEIYGYWKERGTKYIIHHSDSYGATIVPDMIEMGVDVWQGVMSSNDIPELIKKYGDKITFMGGLDGADIEKADWTKPWVKDQVRKICEENGHHGFIPCITQGLPMSTYEGLYECIGECIDEMSVELADTFEGNEAYKG